LITYERVIPAAGYAQLDDPRRGEVALELGDSSSEIPLVSWSERDHLLIGACAIGQPAARWNLS
jgi:hypothetical protein